MPKKLHTKFDKFETLFSWESAERAWSPKEREWYIVYSFFFVVLIAFGVLLGEYILVLAIIAFSVLWFAQASIPPQIVTHSITPLGVKTYGKLYKWKTMKHFWFSEKNNIKFLNIDIKDENEKSDRLKRITLLIEKNEDNKIFELLIDHIDYGDRLGVSFNLITRSISGNYIGIDAYISPEK